MRRAGTVVRVAQGLAVVRAAADGDGDDAKAAGDAGNAPPDIGATAVDESLEEVGRIVDVFGPVAAPYLAVSPASGTTAASLLGERLYVR
ncbi:MAG: H/ACA ribonucleoprotein complex subunit GAR1 [Halobacteriaceae archaeon]